MGTEQADLAQVLSRFHQERGERGHAGHTITCYPQLEDVRALGSELPASWSWASGEDSVACNQHEPHFFLGYTFHLCVFHFCAFQ